jgi:hypothetical protein
MYILYQKGLYEKVKFNKGKIFFSHNFFSLNIKYHKGKNALFEFTLYYVLKQL